MYKNRELLIEPNRLTNESLRILSQYRRYLVRTGLSLYAVL